MANGKILSQGAVIFPGSNLARFACVRHTTPIEELVAILESWLGKRPPSVLISVAGSALDLKLDGKMEQSIKTGLESAARATSAAHLILHSIV